MTDLKPIDAYSTAEHVNYVRRNNGRRGNPNPDHRRPLTAGEGGPTAAELEAAGLRGRADPNRRSPRACSSGLDDRRVRAARNAIAQVEQRLDYANRSNMTAIDGVQTQTRVGQLQAELQARRADLAEATEAAHAAAVERTKRLADEDAAERAVGPPPGHAFRGADDAASTMGDEQAIALAAEKANLDRLAQRATFHVNQRSRPIPGGSRSN
jgi:hypothetical protein